MTELLVTMLVFSIVSTAFYQMMFAGTAGSATARDVVRVSDEARLGLNRLVRDTREATGITLATGTGYLINVDFNRDGQITPAPDKNAAGDYEQLSFAVIGGKLYIQACGAALDCGHEKTVLLDGISQVGSTPYFSYSSNLLEYDCSPTDGVATLAELENTTCTGGALTETQKLSALTDIDYAMTVTAGDSSTAFRSHAEIRNKR